VNVNLIKTAMTCTSNATHRLGKGTNQHQGTYKLLLSRFNFQKEECNEGTKLPGCVQNVERQQC
jgi:hypothetical protein